MINKVLEENENIIYTTNAKPGKISLQIFRLVLIGIILIVFYYLLFTTYSGENLFNWTICLCALFILSIFVIYGLIYNLLYKYKYKGSKCYITNKRIILINKDKVTCNYIDNMNCINIAREKNSVAEVAFHFDIDTGKEINNFGDLFNSQKHITFCGIEKPRKVVEIVKELNKNIYIYDDRIKLFGKII